MYLVINENNGVSLQDTISDADRDDVKNGDLSIINPETLRELGYDLVWRDIPKRYPT